MPWTERLWDRLNAERFVGLATILSGTIILLASIRAIIDLNVVPLIIEWITHLFILQAHAQAIIGEMADAKIVIRYLIFAVISIGFFCALGIIAFSQKTDTRKLAADMIMTILGVFIGMATKLVD